MHKNEEGLGFRVQEGDRISIRAIINPRKRMFTIHLYNDEYYDLINPKKVPPYPFLFIII